MSEPWMESVGQPESCDWCGRPGIVRQHEIYVDGTLTCRNPSLCDVCFVIFDAPGDIIDAFYEAGISFVEVVEGPMETALAERWREKVRRGSRREPY